MSMPSIPGAVAAYIPPSRPDFPVSKAYRHYVTWMLCAVYSINILDRQLLTILMEPIKREFLISDLKLGLLSGPAFVLFYSTVGMPLARYADRANRAAIIAWSITAWSAFTALTGFALNYWQLLLARIGVAVGEAGCNPAAYSILSDYYEQKRRGKALAVYQSGAYLGSFLGFLLGGVIAQVFGWRTAFLVVGVPGIAIALIVKFTLREPPRGLSEAKPAHTEEMPPSSWLVLKKLFSKPSFRHIAMASALHTLAIYGISNFFPSFLSRSHGMTVGEAGVVLAIIYLTAGASGAYLAGALCDRFAERKNDPRYYLWIPGACLLLTFPLGQFVYILENKFALFGVYMPYVALGAGYLAPSIAATFLLIGNRERALASALLLLILNMIGLGLGPTLSGFFSDLLKHQFIEQGLDAKFAEAEGLRWTLRFMITANVWSALHYFWGARHLRRDIAAHESAKE